MIVAVFTFTSEFSVFHDQCHDVIDVTNVIDRETSQRQMNNSNNFLHPIGISTGLAVPCKSLGGVMASINLLF